MLHSKTLAFNVLHLEVHNRILCRMPRTRTRFFGSGVPAPVRRKSTVLRPKDRRPGELLVQCLVNAVIQPVSTRNRLDGPSQHCSPLLPLANELGKDVVEALGGEPTPDLASPGPIVAIERYRIPVGGNMDQQFRISATPVSLDSVVWPWCQRRLEHWPVLSTLATLESEQELLCSLYCLGLRQFEIIDFATAVLRQSSEPVHERLNELRHVACLVRRSPGACRLISVGRALDPIRYGPDGCPIVSCRPPPRVAGAGYRILRRWCDLRLQHRTRP
jgi:hypothetical protein